jgi:uncharacterized membrane protein YhaH (DUF805 family)
MNEPHNPYAPPQTTVADIILEDKIFQRVKIFSTAGRMGRIRLFAYAVCSWVGILIALFLFALILAKFVKNQSMLRFVGNNIDTILLTMVAPIFVLNFFWCIQRSHDMNWSGWTAILALIPIIWLVWVIKKGTPETNRFGAPPESDNLGVQTVAVLGVLMITIGSISFIFSIINA